MRVNADEAIARRAWIAAARWARGRRASEAAVASAFDAWWASIRPPPEPPERPERSERIPDDAPSWWHGRGPELGRCLYDRQGRRTRNRALDTLPLDGGYAPSYDRPEDREQGRFRRTIVTSNGDVYTIIAWWEHIQDAGDWNGNACFVVRGDHAYSSAAMVAAFPLHFPGQAIQLAAAGVDIVEEEP